MRFWNLPGHFIPITQTNSSCEMVEVNLQTPSARVGDGRILSPDLWRILLTGGFGGILISLMFATLMFGPVFLSTATIMDVLLGEGEPVATAIIMQIRLPRMVLGIVVGVSLALSGAALQGMLRNPLADPGLVGVSSGASIGAVGTIVLGTLFLQDFPAEIRAYVLPSAAFVGALLVTLFVFRISKRAGSTSVATLILAGVAVTAVAEAFIGVMTFISDDQQLRDLSFWRMGGLGQADWLSVGIASGAILFASVFLLRMARALDLFQLGEAAAFHAGLSVETSKRRVAVCSALAVGAGTAVAGPISFIGLVAPHIARLCVGPSYRFIVPAAAIIGAALVTGADLVVRNIVPPAEPPIGIATSLIGGPFFLWLLLTRMKGRHHA